MKPLLILERVAVEDRPGKGAAFRAARVENLGENRRVILPTDIRSIRAWRQYAKQLGFALQNIPSRSKSPSPAFV